MTEFPGEEGQPLSKDETEQLVAELVGSELKKNVCGLKLIDDYNSVKQAYDPEDKRP